MGFSIILLVIAALITAAAVGPMAIGVHHLSNGVDAYKHWRKELTGKTPVLYPVRALWAMLLMIPRPGVPKNLVRHANGLRLAILYYVVVIGTMRILNARPDIRAVLGPDFEAIWKFF